MFLKNPCFDFQVFTATISFLTTLFSNVFEMIRGQQ